MQYSQERFNNNKRCNMPSPADGNKLALLLMRRSASKQDYIASTERMRKSMQETERENWFF